MPPRKYLKEEEFVSFRDNHFSHLVRKVERIAGRQDVLIAVGVGIFIAMVVLLFR